MDNFIHFLLTYSCFCVFLQYYKLTILMISKNTIKYIRSLDQKKNRIRDKVFVAEGPKVVADLAAVGMPRLIIGTEEWFRTNNYSYCSNCYIVSDDELRHISFQQHPQQVLAVFDIPKHDLDYDACTKNLCLGLDGVQDPGNLGTIIRIADWFGISTIYCGTGTVDAFSPKVVQATMGSIARIRLAYCELPSLIKLLPPEVPIYGTSLDGNDIYDTKLTPAGLIIMGNEGKGISHDVMQLVNNRLLIPNYGQNNGIDSLNVAVATAVTCAEFRRRFKQ